MVTYNKLSLDYYEKLEDLTPKEVMSILESLIKKYYDADYEHDYENHEKYYDELEAVVDSLDNKFKNIRAYTWRTKFFYGNSLLQFRLRKYILRDSYRSLESYIYLYDQLTSNYLHLCSLLNTYYLNYSNSIIDEIIGHLLIEHDMEDVCDKNIDDELWDNYGVNGFLMDNLDNLISNVRDSILETMKIIDERFYSPNDSEEVLKDAILDVKNHVHELIENDSYKYQREKGVVDLELGWINVFTIEHELNKDYGKLKKKSEDLFDGDNGFNNIIRVFYEHKLENNPNLKFEEDMIYHPHYNIMESRFIPPESQKDEKKWEKYDWRKNRG